jgi:ubiquitin C-terminal hydrolase
MVLGLVNLGNTCYLNSTLQSIIPLTNFWNQLFKEDKDHELVNFLRGYFINDKMGNTIHNPENIYEWLKRKNPDFSEKIQHDVHEAITFIFDNVPKLTSKKIKFITVTRVQCIHCDYFTENREEHNSIVLQITDTFQNSIKEYEKKNIIDWCCDRCKFKKANKYVKISKYGEYYCFVFNRYEPKNYKKEIDIPLKYKDKRVCSFIIHSGNSMGHGHYVAIIHYRCEWYLADDERIFEITKEKALTVLPNAYIVFYK